MQSTIRKAEDAPYDVNGYTHDLFVLKLLCFTEAFIITRNARHERYYLTCFLGAVQTM